MTGYVYNLTPSMVTGQYTGNGAATQAITGLGIRPRFLIIYPVTTSPNNAQIFKADVDGLNSLLQGISLAQTLYETGNIISLDADGFTVGNLGGESAINNANLNAIIYTYIAFL